MIFALLALTALAVLAPLLLVLRRRATASRGTREPALELHRIQLAELDRDLAEGRLLPSEHKTAMLEVQRRMLTAAAQEEAAAKPGLRWPVVAAIVAVPAIAAGLYVASGGRPFLPSAGADSPETRMAQENALIDELRDRLTLMDPTTERAKRGYVLLGNAEMSRGNFGQAAEAYRMALRAGFDPNIAAIAAEASARAEGGVSESTADLFRRALSAAPSAPWRAAAEARLAQPRLAKAGQPAPK